MHFPFIIHISGTPLLLHGIMETAGMFVAYRYYVWLKRKQGDTVSSTNRLSVVAGAIFGSLLGSHLIGALEDVPAWTAAVSRWLYFYNNKTLVGGLLGGLAGVELVKWLIGERQNTGDLFTFPLILGMIIGRIGCFSVGIYEETYGLPTTLPWGMDLGDGLHRHPVTLYEIAFLLVSWAALAAAKKRYPLRQGALFKLFLISYLVFRLALDVIKPGWRYLLGLGTIQLSCLAGLLYYWRYLLHPSLFIDSKTKDAC